MLALLIFFYHSHNNLSFYLVSRLCFFDNKLSYQFFIYSKKNYKTPILSIQLELSIAYCIIFAHVPKVNFVSTSFSISNSNIIKADSFLHETMTTIAKIWFILKTNIFNVPIMTKFILMHLLSWYQFLLKYLFYCTLAFITHTNTRLNKIEDVI